MAHSSESPSAEPTKRPPVVITNDQQVVGSAQFTEGYQQGLEVGRAGIKVKTPPTMEGLSAERIGYIRGVQQAELDAVIRRAGAIADSRFDYQIPEGSAPQPGDATSNYLEQMKADRLARDAAQSQEGASA